MFSSHLCIHYMILKFFNLFHLILFEYVFVIFFNTMNYRESYHLILITYVVCIYMYISHELYRINKCPQTFEGQCICCIVEGTKGSNLWTCALLTRMWKFNLQMDATRFSTNGDGQTSWKRNTTRDIFTCSFENINVLRKEACLCIASNSLSNLR